MTGPIHNVFPLILKTFKDVHFSNSFPLKCMLTLFAIKKTHNILLLFNVPFLSNDGWNKSSLTFWIANVAQEL
jgi:hypothetical protein